MITYEYIYLLCKSCVCDGCIERYKFEENHKICMEMGYYTQMSNWTTNILRLAHGKGTTECLILIKSHFLSIIQQ